MEIRTTYLRFITWVKISGPGPVSGPTGPFMTWLRVGMKRWIYITITPWNVLEFAAIIHRLVLGWAMGIVIGVKMWVQFMMTRWTWNVLVYLLLCGVGVCRGCLRSYTLSTFLRVRIYEAGIVLGPNPGSKRADDKLSGVRVKRLFCTRIFHDNSIIANTMNVMKGKGKGEIYRLHRNITLSIYHSQLCTLTRYCS